jgi:hypothetical protein
MNLEALLLPIITTIMLSAFVQSVTGFGFGLVAMSLLPLFLDFKSAYFVLIVPNLVLCTVNFALNIRNYQWRQGIWLIGGSCLATPVGYWFMTSLKSDLLLRGLGLLICVFSASEVLMSKRRPLQIPERFGLPMGLFSGLLSGGFNMGGPPAIAYVYSQTWAKEHIVALLQLVFGTSTALRLGLMQGTDAMTPELWRVSAWAILPLLVAVFVGNRVLRKLQHQHLRLAVFILLFVIGVKYLGKL